jgi:predicted NAD/FAD-binding protein
MVYHHPVFTAGRAAAQRRHRELIDHHGISYCGAYWGNGFHEDGVNSGLAVAEALNAVPARARHERLALQEAAF